MELMAIVAAVALSFGLAFVIEQVALRAFCFALAVVRTRR